MNPMQVFCAVCYGIGWGIMVTASVQIMKELGL